VPGLHVILLPCDYRARLSLVAEDYSIKFNFVIQTRTKRRSFAQKVWNSTDAVGGLFISGLHKGDEAYTGNPTDGVGGWFISGLHKGDEAYTAYPTDCVGGIRFYLLRPDVGWM
jgi:hypothetical protein